jgi:hypothetical protein
VLGLDALLGAALGDLLGGLLSGSFGSHCVGLEVGVLGGWGRKVMKKKEVVNEGRRLERVQVGVLLCLHLSGQSPNSKTPKPIRGHGVRHGPPACQPQQHPFSYQ